jgi:hypothetical protein
MSSWSAGPWLRLRRCGEPAFGRQGHQPWGIHVGGVVIVYACLVAVEVRIGCAALRYRDVRAATRTVSHRRRCETSSTNAVGRTDHSEVQFG